MMMSMLLFIVINYINLFVFDDEIEMKNNTDINICSNKSEPFIHETEHARYMQSIIHSFGSKKLAPCKQI